MTHNTTAATAVLLLALCVCAAAQSEVATNSHDKGGQPVPTTCRFGWVPVTFDSQPKPIGGQKRRPQDLNYRCAQACAAVGVEPAYTEDGKPLCYFQSKRALGALYNIYGTWFNGEESMDFESTCRGRNEAGAPYMEWATRWNETSQQVQYGFLCGCSGCVYGCYPAPPPQPRKNVTLGPNVTAPFVGAFECKGANQAWGLDPNVMPDGDPSKTCPLLTPPGAVNSWSYPYPVCEGKTANNGWEWGTRPADGTCSTYNANVADQPKAFCTADPAKLLPKPNPMPWPTPSPHAMSDLSTRAIDVDRLDLLLGVEQPRENMPTRDQVTRLSQPDMHQRLMA